MTSFNPKAAPTANLKDKVVVLTGGATGIGAAMVSHLHSLGAKVIFGDVNVDVAESLVQTLAPESSLDEDPGVHFLKCDVRSHSDNLALIKSAMDKYWTRRPCGRECRSHGARKLVRPGSGNRGCGKGPR